MSRWNRVRIIWIAIALAILLFPFFVSSSYVIGVMCFIAIYGALALGKAVLLEQAGIFSLAHPTWFGIGAYVTGIASARGLPPVLSILLAAAFVAFVAFILGAPLLRLKGYYLACATFSLMLIIEILIANMGSLTGGHDGLMGIPALTIGGVTLEGDLHFYFLAWGLCLGSFWFLNNLMHSRMGRAIRAFNDSEAASRSMGVNVSAYKLRIFIITAVLASLVGSLFCFWIRYIMPALFGFSLLVELITMIIIGGGKTLYGPLLGSFVVMWMRELIHAYLGKLLPVMTAEVDALFFGVIIVVILIYMPGGLAGWLEQLALVGGRIRARFTKPGISTSERG
jgi:branched-chain amino acid transport system permease protein